MQIAKSFTFQGFDQLITVRSPQLGLLKAESRDLVFDNLDKLQDRDISIYGNAQRPPSSSKNTLPRNTQKKSWGI